MTNINLDVQFVVETCCYEDCGITFAMTAAFKNQRRKDHKNFYCPNGHGQHYAQKSDEEKLRQELRCCRLHKENWRSQAERLERSRRSYMGHVTRLKRAAREDEPDEDNSRDSTT